MVVVERSRNALPSASLRGRSLSVAETPFPSATLRGRSLSAAETFIVFIGFSILIPKSCSGIFGLLGICWVEMQLIASVQKILFPKII